MNHIKMNHGTKKLTLERDVLLFFLLCWIAYFSAYLGRLNFSASIAEIVSAGDMTKSQAGLVGSGFFFGYGIFQLFSGMLGDRLNTRLMIFTGLFGSACINFMMGMATGFQMMLVLWTFNGIFQSLIWSPLVRTMSDLLTGVQCMRCCINFATTTPFGTLGAYLMSAGIIYVANWRTVFIVAGGILCVVALLWLFGEKAIEEIACKRGDEEESVLPLVNATEQTQSSNRLPLLLLSAVACAALLHGILKDSIMTWAPTYISETFGIASVISIIVTMLLPIVNLSGVYFANHLNRARFHNELTTSAWLFIATTLSLVLLMQFGHLNLLFAVGMMAASTSLMLGVNTMLITLAPLQFKRHGKVSTVAGALNAVTAVGSALSTYGIGALTEYFGWSVALAAWLTISLAGILVCALTAKFWKYARE